MKRRVSMMAIGLLIAFCGVGGVALGADETGSSGGGKEIVLQCAPGVVNESVTSKSAAVTHPGCFCDTDGGQLQDWLETLVDDWLAGQPLPQPAEGVLLLDDLAPGESRDVTLFCYSPEQIAAYREAVLAQAGGTAGED